MGGISDFAEILSIGRNYLLEAIQQQAKGIYILVCSEYCAVLL
jgi:hypothetical protein